MTATAITLVRNHDTQPAGLVFVDELPTRRTTGKYASVAAGLRENAGKWAAVKTFSPAEKHRGWSFANVVNSGKLIDFPKGKFQASAISDDHATRVYVRFQPVAQVRS